MIEDFSPDPDELLRAIQREESQKQSGKLKIFFGMSAGVGKTYSMLDEAQHLLSDGIDIVVGTINTHGRKETEDLLKDIPVIPEKWVKYRDTVFEEMDLETILQQKHEIVIVDELAHTNVPGSKHLKRWQDVLEILDAGIDVYTTLNVQHVESRKDIIESITGVKIRETVPDLILERASSIELIDISPSILLQRLREGKVYLGDQSQIAAQNFFKEDKLMALREIALRFTAEKVDHDLHLMLSQGKGWKPREKLMVAVSPNPFSEQLIRIARRRAFELDAPWIALYVDTGKTLSDEEQTHLTNHLNLARELGAEVITTHDLDIPTALQRLANQKNITQLVIGWPNPRPFFYRIFHKSLLERLHEGNKQFDLLVLRQDHLTRTYPGIHPAVSLSSPLRDYWLALVSLIFLNCLGFLLLPLIGYKSVGFIFLLGIIVLSFFLGQGAIFFTAILSTLSWDYFFIPPIFTFSISNPEDTTLIILYFCTAAIIGGLTSRIRKKDSLLQLHAKKLEHLYEIEREIANAANFQFLRQNVCAHLQSIFHGQFDILIKGEDNQLVFESQLAGLQNEKERGAAQWVFQNGQNAGWSTSTLPASEGLYIPIKFFQTQLGVLAYYPKIKRLLFMDEMNFLQTVAQQMGIYLERHLFEERLLHQSYTTQVEKLHNSILSSISEEFYTPLHKIFEAIRQLRTTAPIPKESNQLLQTIEQTTRHLKLTIENLLISAELESGFVRLEKEKLDVKAFVETCVNGAKPLLQDHSIIYSFPETPCFLSFDPRLMGFALKNLLIQAKISSPPRSPITIECQEGNHFFRISVLDEGLGISQEALSIIFDKFYQHPQGQLEEGNIPNLRVAKSVMDIHQGKIEARNREDGKGSVLTLFLPL